MLTHKGTVPLTTQRLRLRRFRPEDAQAMYTNWASDPEVTRYLTWAPHVSPDATRELLEDWTAKYEDPTYYNWVIELDGAQIGNVSVVRFDERSLHAELGYCMGKRWWNKGIMTEAVREVTRFLFGEVGFHKLKIRHLVKNPGSGRVAQKCGFTREGILLEEYLSDGEFMDIAVYGKLKSDSEEN